MKMISINSFLFTITSLILYSDATAENTNLCNFFKKKVNYGAYLLDARGNISNGPINFGSLQDDGGSEEIIARTKYKILLFPKNAIIENNDCSENGCLRLTKILPVCKNVATYSLDIKFIFRRKEKNREAYLYNENLDFYTLKFFHPQEEIGELEYKFSPKIQGIIFYKGRALK